MVMLFYTISYGSDDGDDDDDNSDDDEEDADDGGALLSYVSDGRVFLSQDQQHTQMSCPLSCSNHPATWHDVVDDDDYVMMMIDLMLFVVDGDDVDVNDDDNVDDVLVMVINLQRIQMSCSNHLASLLPSSSSSLTKWSHTYIKSQTWI